MLGHFRRFAHLPEIGILRFVRIMEARPNRRARVAPVPVQRFRFEQRYRRGIHIAAVDRKIHRPFAFSFVVYDVGRPAVTEQSFLGKRRIFGGYFQFRVELFGVVEIVFEKSPVDEIVRTRVRYLRAEYVINLFKPLFRIRVGIGIAFRVLVGKHYRRVVHRHGVV